MGRARTQRMAIRRVSKYFTKTCFDYKCDFKFLHSLLCTDFIKLDTLADIFLLTFKYTRFRKLLLISLFVITIQNNVRIIFSSIIANGAIGYRKTCLKCLRPGMRFST